MIPCRTQLWRPSPAAEKFYGEQKPLLDRVMRDRNSRDASPYEFFLKTFGDLPLRHPLKHEFLILCWEQQWPTTLQIESRGVLNTWLIRMARGLCFSERLVMMGCGSSSKTTCTAAYCYTTWKARPFNASIFLSTTSAEAGESRTWGAVKDFHKSDVFKVGKRIESLHLITLDEEIRDEEGVKERDFRDVIKCINIKSGQEGKNVVASIVGRKNDIVIWHCDEFNFMDIGVLGARVNLNTNPRNQFIGTGNAPEEGDPMYIDATPFGPKYPDGWRSVDKDRDQSWTTETGLCLYFNGTTSPNYKALDDRVPFPKLMNEEFRKRIEKDSKGVDTPYYWKQFHGFPPTVDISDKVLSYKLMQQCGAFDEPIWVNTQQKVLAGLDLGFRKSGDPSVIHFGKVGRDTRGKNILATEPDGIALTPKQGDPRPFEEQIASQVIAESRKRGCHDIAADVTGDGGILVQAIEKEGRKQSYAINVLAVSFSGTASDHVVIPGEKRTGKEMFDRKVSEIWMLMRESTGNHVIRGMRERSRATSELCSRRYTTDEKKRFSVEKKELMKERLRHSPDFGDSCALLNFLALRHGLSGVEVVKKTEPFDPVKFIQQKTGIRYGSPQRSVYSGR